MCTAHPTDKAVGNATTNESPLTSCVGRIDLEVRGRGRLLNCARMQPMILEPYEQLNLPLGEVEGEAQ